jgi:anaerobic selenocysteine-containing dehydrogenase
VAGRLVAIRDRHGGHTIAYYGGGGQGNHLGGAYAGPLRQALGTPYLYNSLAQEKTGDFWVNGRLFGKQTCHLTEGIEEADYVLLIGTNPWQSHGIPRARQVLRELAQDPQRTLVVVDPRRTRTAELADLHLQVRPGTDAFLMAAMLGVIVQEGLEDGEFLAAHTVGHEQIVDTFMRVPVGEYAGRAGISLETVYRVARGFAGADSACSRHDLGVEHSLHSTLNTYLEKLLPLLTGNFGKPGGNNLHTQFMPLIGHSREPEEGGAVTRVTGMREISKLFPPNVLPAEMLQSAADTDAYQRAFGKLDLLVAIDVAETETTQLADYVLPASSQFEKWEATFFTLSFPTNHFHLRRPLLEPSADTLHEPEIYRRLVVAMGELPDRMPWLERAARWHLRAPRWGILPKALALAVALRPRLRRYLSLVLYSTLGRALPGGAASAAVIWGSSRFYAARYARQVRRAGHRGRGAMLGENLFRAILQSDTAVALSTHRHDEMWDLVRHTDGRVHLEIAQMLEELEGLANEPRERSDAAEFPFVLAAGERRSYNANQVYRDPAWRRSDREGALRMHPADADRLGLMDGQQVVCESAGGSLEACLRCDDSMLPGSLSLPHGYGQVFPDREAPEKLIQSGPRVNQLTSTAHCDPWARTPYHKYVPVRVRAAGPLTSQPRATLVAQ